MDVTLDRRDWILLVVTLPIIAVISLGAHDVAISHLGIPYPAWHLPTWVTAIGQASRIAGALLLYRCAERYFGGRSLLAATLTIGFLMVFLQETLRVICVEFALTEGWVDGRWIYTLLTHAPAVVVLIVQAGLAVLIGRFAKRPVAIGLLVCAAGALIAYAVTPALQSVPPAMFERFSMPEPQELYQEPYDWRIYRVIYSTFIEPTVACFILAVLVWPGLKGSQGRKIVLFTALILLVRGRFAGQLLNVFWLDMPFPMAMASFGQFFLETLLMAALTGLVWSRIERA